MQTMGEEMQVENARIAYFKPFPTSHIRGYRKKAAFSIWPSYRYSQPISANVKPPRFPEEGIRSHRISLEVRPVDGQEPRAAELDDGVKFKVVLAQVNVRPLGRIGCAMKWVGAGTDSVVNDEKCHMVQAVSAAHILKNYAEFLVASYPPQGSH